MDWEEKRTGLSGCVAGFEEDVRKLGDGELAKPYKRTEAGIEVREPNSR
jgi:hypothetical protein